jgi:hypothetical protein
VIYSWVERRAQRMKDVMELAVIDVESLTVRAVGGAGLYGTAAGAQAELIVKTRRGELTLRLIPRGHKQVRLIDLRGRDRKQAKRARTAHVPFPAERA